jgi:hypothetical protein
MNVFLIQPTFEGSSLCWLFERDDQKIGVHKTEGWCTRLRDEKPIFFSNEERCMLIMILLELKVSEFDEHLGQAARLAPEFASSIQQFPLKMLIKHVFHSCYSDYWPEKAMNWLDEKPQLLPLFVDELEHMYTHKVMSQSLRHRARSMWRSVTRDDPSVVRHMRHAHG